MLIIVKSHVWQYEMEYESVVQYISKWCSNSHHLCWSCASCIKIIILNMALLLVDHLARHYKEAKTFMAITIQLPS